MEMLRVYTDENLEFLLSILTAMDYDTLLHQRFGFQMLRTQQDAYIQDIRTLFAPYLKTPVFDLLRDMLEAGFFLGRPIELMLSLASPGCFTSIRPLSNLCILYSGGMERIHMLLSGLEELYVHSGYSQFFAQHVSRYADFISRTQRQVQRFHIAERLEQEYGWIFGDGKILVTGLLCGNYGIRFAADTGVSEVYAVFADSVISEDPEENEFSGGALSLNMLFHEFSHPYINPLTEKYHTLAGSYVSAYEKLRPYKLPGMLSGYGDWEECINEHFVRAMAIHLLRDCGFGDWAQRYYERNMQEGYRYLPEILQAYENYDRSRNLYPDFAAFYPILLTVFSGDV